MNSRVFFGTFFISLATLTLELVLTRIWSVITFYHFAFMAVSLAMFGLTIGAVLVYLFPVFFSQKNCERNLSVSALLFALAVVFGYLTQLCVPFFPSRSILGLYLASLTFGAAALPFCFSGVCLSVAFTNFSKQIGKLYAADLVGAAFGCLLLYVSLSIADATTTILLIASTGALAAYLFAAERQFVRVKGLSLLLCVTLCGLASANGLLAQNQKPLIRFIWSKGEREMEPIYEKWNPISRITVTQDKFKPSQPYAWGLSSTYKPTRKTNALWLNMDSLGQTPILEYSGNCADVDFLRYDVTEFVYYLSSPSRVCIVGAGGGRDVIAALCAGAKTVAAVDINPGIISTLNQQFGDFSGHLDRRPGVTFAAEDARSFISRQKNAFDLIQISVIETAILSSNGALALTENSLYTVEAWTRFLEHLSPGGIISCSRWYSPSGPGEVERLVAVASTALQRCGIDDPRRHIIVVEAHNLQWWGQDTRCASVLVSKVAFSPEQLDDLKKAASALDFNVILSPSSARSRLLELLAAGKNYKGTSADTLVNLDPSTDDSPFFFYLIRPWDLFLHPGLTPGTSSTYVKGEYVLIELLFVLSLMTAGCLFLPLLKKGKSPITAASWPIAIFFTAIGFGYILVEISQMQRLVIFLGHPTYSITVVLFSLLLSSGLGSYLTNKVADRLLFRSAIASLLVLLVLLLAYSMVAASVLEPFVTAETTTRAAVAAGLLLPLGLFMGMAFPLAFRLADMTSSELKPWLWGINGAASVCGSALSMLIAIGAGLKAAYFTGCACYLIALVALMIGQKKINTANTN